MNKNKAKIIISIIVLIITIIISFNKAYSFYNAKVIKENETETLLSSKKLELIFEDTKEVNVKDILPGDSVTKTFTVRSNADEKLSYNIKYKDITNSFQNDMVYTLICDGKQIVEETPLPVTKSEEYILENIEINPKEEKEYILTIKFLYKEEEQNEQQGSIFKATVEIDLEKNTEPLIVTNETTKEITNKEIEEQEEIVKEFRIRNAESTETIMYSVNLSEIVNTYEKEELSYTLEKNGEIINTSNIPKAGEFTYITYNQEIETGITDNYKLTITKNLEEIEGKEFSTAIEVEAREVKNSIPTSKIILESKKTNSITVAGSCVDSESGIQKYSFYKDGKLEKEINTTEENYKYTYKELNNKEYELKLVCTNNYDVISEAIINEIPVELKEPVIEKTDEYEQTKIVKVKYSNEVSKYLKITGEVISNVELKECNEDLKCEDILSIGSKLKENVWYETTSDVELTYETNGSIRAKITDTTNTKETKEVEIINIDKTKPEVIIEINGNSTYEKSQGTKVTVSDNLSGISELKYQWTASETEPEEVSFATEFTSGDILTKSEGTGDYYLWILAKDNAGNKTLTKSNVFKLDNTSPSCKIEEDPTSWTTSAILTVSGIDSESGISRYLWDGTNYSSTQTKTITANGTYMAYVKDNAGNIAECSKEVSNIDTTSPIAKIETKTKTSNSITVKGSCSDSESGIKRYEFYIDGEKKATYDITSTSKDYTYEKITSGSHTYKLVCTNKATLTSTISGIETTTNLEIPTYTVASGYAKNKTTTISYKGEGAYLLKITGSVTSDIELIDCGTISNNGEYTCSTTVLPVGSNLEENKWYKASSNPTLTYTSNGTIIAKTADGVNYKQGSSLTIDGVDTTSPSKPTVTLKLNDETGSSYTSGTWTNNNVYVEINATDDNEIDYYEWYDSSWNKITTNNVTYESNIDLPIKVRAIDKAGNISEETSFEIKIDKTKPSCSWSGESTTYRKSATIKVTCNDSESGCEPLSTSKEWNYTTTSKTASLSYTIKDNAGNTNTCNKTANVYVDTTSPTKPIITNSSDENWSNTNVTITLSSTDDHSGLSKYQIKYSGNNNTWSDVIENPQAWSEEINETLYYRAVDKLENISEESITNIKIDKTKPTVTFGTNGNSTYEKSQSTKVTVSDNLSGVNTLKYQWTTSETEPEEESFTTSFTNESTLTKTTSTGDYYLWILAIDNAGNKIITKSNVFKLDNTAPTCNISGNPTIWTTSATLTASGTDTGGSGLSTVVFTGTTSSSKTVTTNGEVSATVTDKAGNTNTCSVTVSKIDTAKPTCSISGVSTSWAKSATLTVSGTDSQSGVASYSWDGTNYSSTKTKSISSNGTYTAYVKDNVGRVQSCSVTVSKIDTAAPATPTITNNSNGNWTRNNVVITASSSDSQSGLNRIEYSYNNSTWYTDWDSAMSNNKVTGTWSAERNNTVYIRAVDNVGRVSGNATTTVRIDKTTPSLSIRTGNYEMTSTTGIVSSVSYGASGGSVSCIDKSLSNKSVSNMNNLGYLGKHSISCTAKGNTGNTKTVTGTISIQRTYTGSQLNYGGAAKISGTSLLLTPTTSSNHGHQYGPYVAALAGRYRVWYYGNNLNTFATTDEQAASSNGGNRYFAYYNLGQSWLTIESLNYVSADSNYYITLGSNVTNLEINIVNYSKFWTTTIDKVIISPA